MSTTYDWPPAFGVDHFEMRVMHNTKAFVSPFSSTSQVLNYTGERWQMVIGLVAGRSAARGAAQEAYFDRLNGPANRIRLWNLRRPLPLGTMRGGAAVSVVNGSLAAVSVVNASAAAVTVMGGVPCNVSDIAVGAGATTIQTLAGLTLEAGDHIGLANGQNVRNMATATADANGLMPIEFQPRAREAISAFGAIAWNKPTVEMMLKADGVPVGWSPGKFEGTSAELVEAL